ncbi:hypothetical protein ACF8C6_08865 [Pseudomonas sp. zbq_18]|uniref:hypothetical protein n=1 Tax=Pseudomonas sp. zbq_18 TaxID=3367251 RepID=UPI00370A20C2
MPNTTPNLRGLLNNLARQAEGAPRAEGEKAMNQSATDYLIAPADALELSGATLLPFDLRRKVLARMAAQRDQGAMLDLFAQVLGMANAVVENCRIMTELILTEEGMHPHTAEKANLPTMYGALQGVLLADGVSQKGTCAGCAYRLGTPANTSPITTSEASHCQRELMQFNCHLRLDKEGQPTKACAGHRRAMRHQGAT